MRPRVISQTGAGNSAAMPLDINTVEANVALAVVVTGTVNYTIQHTYDDVQNSAVTPTWWDHGVANLVAATTNQEGNFVLPVTACRIKQNSGSGTTTLTALQGGII